MFQLQIWDTAGQERFRTITQSYYRSANGVIIAYDITKKGSFESVPRWIEDVKRYAGPNIVQCIIGDYSYIYKVETTYWENLRYFLNALRIMWHLI